MSSSTDELLPMVEECVLKVRDREIPVFVGVFKNVENISELKPMLMKGKISVALISAKKVVSLFQLLVATNTALHNQEDGIMKTKNINTEIIFSLSPGKKISEALRQFGAADEDTAVAAVAVRQREPLLQLAAALRAAPAPAADLPQLCDPAAVRQLYQLTAQELAVGSLEEAVCNQLATRCAS